MCLRADRRIGYTLSTGGARNATEGVPYRAYAIASPGAPL